jgi:hypothetical protein
MTARRPKAVWRLKNCERSFGYVKGYGFGKIYQIKEKILLLIKYVINSKIGISKH